MGCAPRARGSPVKDARFSDAARWREQHAELRRRGAALFAEFGDPIPLLSGVAKVLRGERDTAAELPAELASEVEGFAGEREVRALGALFAIARCLAAEALSGEPSAERLQVQAERLHRSPAWVLEAFEVEVLALLERCESAVREGWLTAFEAAPPLPTRAAGPAAAVQVFRPQGRWKIEDPFELWNDRDANAALILVSAYAPGGLLREADPDRWFRAVDRWDDGRLVEGALFGSHVAHDADALMHWLAVASPVFDAAGAWTGRTAASILTLRVLDHAKELVTATLPAPGAAEEPGAIAELRDRELPALFDKAWRVLLARPDGLVLATALHTRLSAPDNWPRGWRVDYPAIARRCLEQVLASARPPARVLRSLHARRQYSGGQPARGPHASALTALRAAVAIAPDEPANDVELVEWFVELLSSDSADWQAFAHMGALDGLLSTLANRFARIPGVLERCDVAYRALEPGRRRGEFARGHGQNDAERASILLLAVVLGILQHRGNEELAGEMGDALARTFQRSLRLALVKPQHHVATVSARSLLACAIAVRAKADPGSLKTCLAPVLSDPGHAAECVKTLLGVVPADVIAQALDVGTQGLRGFVAHVEAWAAATGHPDDRAAAEGLASALRAKGGVTPERLDRPGRGDDGVDG